MQWFTLLVLIIYIIVLGKKKNIIRPNSVFIIIMLTTLLISGLHLSEYQNYYSSWFYVLIYICLILFSLVSNLITRYQRNDVLDVKIQKEGMESYKKSTLVKITTLLWMAIILSFIVMLLKLGLPPALSLSAERSEYFLSGWGSIYCLNTTLIALLLFDRYQKKVMPAMLFYLYIVSTLVLVIFMANKFQIFSILIVWVTMKSILKKGKSIKTIIFISIVALIIFIILYSTIYLKMYNFSNEDVLYWYKINLPSKYNFLGQPYLYIASNYENLYVYMLSNHHYMWGYNIIYNITRSFDFCNKIYGSLIGSYYSEFNRSLHMGTMNTGTIFLLVYRDFGIIGMILYSAVIGGICGYIQKRLSEKRTFYSVFLYAYAMISVFLSFFTDAFFAKTLLINILAAAIISWFIHGKMVFMLRKGKND